MILKQANVFGYSYVPILIVPLFVCFSEGGRTQPRKQQGVYSLERRRQPLR